MRFAPRIIRVVVGLKKVSDFMLSDTIQTLLEHQITQATLETMVSNGMVVLRD